MEACTLLILFYYLVCKTLYPKVYMERPYNSRATIHDNARYQLFSRFFDNRNDFGSFNIGGNIRIDYGLQTFKFGAGLDEAEGKYILNTLTNKHFINEKKLQ